MQLCAFVLTDCKVCFTLRCNNWVQHIQNLSCMLMLQDLGVALTAGYKSIKVEEPAKRKGGIMVASVAELMDKLRNEAKVL